MESNWAAEHLQTIRTLMERSAIYRRALAPIMIFNGCLGIAGAGASWIANIESARAFVLVWTVVAIIALVGSLLLVRRQAIKDSEPFWSPPTRRVAHAMLPALTVGMLAGGVSIFDQSTDPAVPGMISLIWSIAYGCALHAAGFFTPRGIRLLGWLFILAGCGCALALFLTSGDGAAGSGHGGGHGSPLDFLFDGRGLFMGITFGGLHLAYGIYLYFTEKRGNET
jgi:hypothetical protein